MKRRRFLQSAILIGADRFVHAAIGSPETGSPMPHAQMVVLDGHAASTRFDGVGIVDGGGATSVLLKDYPEPQRSQILDLVYKPKFGASISTLYVEIPGDGNSTQGSMPSHMHRRDDLNYSRGYIWWVLREAKRRNPALSLDANVWSAPGWIGDGNFWSRDAVEYDLKWLQGLRDVYGIELDAIGCRNEKGVSYDFVEMLRPALDANGFQSVKIHAFDNWPNNKLDFVKEMQTDKKLRDSIDIIGAHTYSRVPASPEVQAMASQMHKPIWNTEEHVYKEGFDCAISIVKAFNDNWIRSRASKIVNWYGIAGLYPMQPFSRDPAMLLAHWPWSGHYEVREALWAYAHYGQFTEVGWQYLDAGCGRLDLGGSFVSLKSAGDDYSIILETQNATAPQQVHFQLRGLSTRKLCVWFSDASQKFVELAGIIPQDGAFEITLQPNSIYSLSTTRGQQKGSFEHVPPPARYPLPYREDFSAYSNPKQWGFLPRYTVDIDGAFELSNRPTGDGLCLRQVVPVRPMSWAPDWLPYTIFGDDQWQDYEVRADVYLNAGEAAGIMGRVNEVGTGYGCIPRGYFLLLEDTGQCRLVVIRGKKKKQQTLGDAEQQALVKNLRDDSEGGELTLGSLTLSGVGAGAWHRLKLRFTGSTIAAFIDDNPVLEVTDTLYSQGMAGFVAGADEKQFSTPYFDNLLIAPLNSPAPAVFAVLPKLAPIYERALQH